MKCPKCSEEFPSGTAFCPKCGTSITENEPARPASNRQQKIAVIAGAALLVIIIIALLMKIALNGKSVTQANQGLPTSGPAVTNAAPPTTIGGPSVTNAPSPQPPPTQPTNSFKPEPAPQEVLDYIEFVKRVEAARQALLKDTERAVTLSAESQARSLLDAINMVMDDSSTDQAPKQTTAVTNELAAQTTHWQQLVRYFDATPAPSQCADFVGNYRAALTNQANSIQRILIILSSTNWTDIESISKAQSQLQAMKSDPNLQGNIDKAVEAADKKLAELCTRYNIAKSFEVKKETGQTGSIVGGGF